MTGQQKLLNNRLCLPSHRNADGFQCALPGLICRCSQHIEFQQAIRAEDHVAMFSNGCFCSAVIVRETQLLLRIFIEDLDGMISNDKFGCTRWGVLQLSWWRRPNRLRR